MRRNILRESYGSRRDEPYRQPPKIYLQAITRRVWAASEEFDALAGEVNARDKDKMLTNKRELRIEFGDCDPGGIVYFPRYFEFVDACTGALFELAGLPQPQMQKMYGIAGIPVVEAKAQFFVPSQFGDRVMVESAVAEWGRSSFSVRHRVLKGDILAAELIEKRVWVMRVSDDPVRFKSISIPWEVKEKFADLPEKQ